VRESVPGLGIFSWHVAKGAASWAELQGKDQRPGSQVAASNAFKCGSVRGLWTVRRGVSRKCNHPDPRLVSRRQGQASPLAQPRSPHPNNRAAGDTDSPDTRATTGTLKAFPIGARCASAQKDRSERRCTRAPDRSVRCRFGSHFLQRQVRETVRFMFGEHNSLLLIELLGDNDNRIADIFAARAMN
jgi:hypothetical protein